jgi:hypothetical protein
MFNYYYICAKYERFKYPALNSYMVPHLVLIQIEKKLTWLIAKKHIFEIYRTKKYSSYLREGVGGYIESFFIMF